MKSAWPFFSTVSALFTSNPPEMIRGSEDISFLKYEIWFNMRGEEVDWVVKSILTTHPRSTQRNNWGWMISSSNWPLDVLWRNWPFLAGTEGDYFFVIYLPLTQSNVSGAYIVSMKILEIIPLTSNPTHSQNSSPQANGFLDFIPFKEVFLVILLIAVLVYILKK